MCGIDGQSGFTFKIWKYYYMAFPDQVETMQIFAKGEPFRDGSSVNVPIVLPPTPYEDGHILIVESATPLTLHQISQREGTIVGRIDCDFSRVPKGWSTIKVNVQCRATIRFEDQDLPCERMLHIAVYEEESSDRRLVGHTRVLMQHPREEEFAMEKKEIPEHMSEKLNFRKVYDVARSKNSSRSSRATLE
ncbi:hypothetical protein P170DRAFT_470381 [Aspergillus steynii IBT 23096]|uniref:Uncharacterized protein n=1 Tax=Aspergillus steynii IBT 23096 TaxID=1392250 RepID=A0A2I2GQ03_9EURO|nr:uncharacterized protein P170DRAFT_470381 [Aspergillus steynii IBT 23096]PLB54952.1 hypothetical protein P170DRAFT_470381 [Aspergillus steynii IBT 23096]